MNYIGEHLLPGQIGRAFIILNFLAAALAAISYFFAEKNSANIEESGKWRSIARYAFSIHGLSIIGYAACMFYVMTYKYYEYQYAQQHVSDDLPFRYIFSAFWEGQEGSFTLWMFWHAVLGWAVMLRSKEWEAPVLATLAAIQVVLASMILGAYFNFGFAEFRLGSNPLLMLRDVMDAPIFNKEDYVKLIKGNGLNPLLQNYWMTIHPPTLFLGFASTSIPFSFAVAALWRNEHRTWLKAVMPWALFSGAILGTGILMGGAWAYEALSFGGYWAWDPVENMSLVPWLILIAGIHTNLIARNTDNAIRSTYIYYLLSFILIVYSTFLTRSGILGDTSVHAFTEMGLEWQLVFFMAAFIALGFGMFFKRVKHIPTVEKEEATGSREFWMFIGTLVLLFSSILITFTTSIPVYNKVSAAFGKPLNLSPPVDVVAHYNKYQLWIGVFIAFLSGATQFLRYKETNFSAYAKKVGLHLGISISISIVLTALAAQWIESRAWQYMLLLFAGIFATVCNLDFIISFMRNNLKAAGSAVAHLGFGLMIIGILASGLNKLFISNNPFAQEGLIEGEDKEFYQKNILLLKNSPMFMSGYEVTYVKDTMWDFTRRFQVNYKRRGMKTAQIVEEFDLFPNVLYDKTFTKIAASNPSTMHYWNKDIFTHVSSLPKADMDPEFRKQQEDSLKYQKYTAKVGDT
ncbi:MAG: cytochrome c biogenesis protein CcsA, partial [Bacteroidia bacterium]